MIVTGRARSSEQIPSVSGDVEEDGDPAVELGARLADKLHAGQSHPSAGGLEVVHSQEESDSASALFPDYGPLIVTVGPSEQDSCLPPRWSHHDPALGASVVGQRRRVLDELKVEHLDEELDRRVIVVHHDRDEFDERHSRVSHRDEGLPCDKIVDVLKLPIRPHPRAGMLIGLVGVGLVVAVLEPFHRHLAAATPGLLLVIPVVAAALLGGRLAAVIVAVIADLALSLGFIPPVGTLWVNLPQDALALLVFVLVAIAVGALVAELSARRAAAERRVDEIAAMHEQLQLVIAERERLETQARRVAVLEEVDRQRASLLRSVSHDLRTPLVTIRAVASDLAGEAPYDDATRHRLLVLVAQEAERLDRIVGNLLSMSRIEAGALAPRFDAVDLDDVARSSVEHVVRMHGDVDIRVALSSELPPVLADFSQLEQVLSNLLDNAARVSPRGSPVELSATRRGPKVVVTVRDYGTGVDPSIRGTLFEPFHSTRPGRTGLGLAICRAIVEAHGGTITIRDEPGGGTSFDFTLDVTG